MPVDRDRLHRTLNPRTVVVAGDRGPNYQWLTNQKEFDGELYSVQVDPNEVKNIEERGFKNFSSLAEVPGEIDLEPTPAERTPEDRLDHAYGLHAARPDRLCGRRDEASPQPEPVRCVGDRQSIFAVEPPPESGRDSEGIEDATSADSGWGEP